MTSARQTTVLRRRRLSLGRTLRGRAAKTTVGATAAREKRRVSAADARGGNRAGCVRSRHVTTWPRADEVRTVTNALLPTGGTRRVRVCARVAVPTSGRLCMWCVVSRGRHDGCKAAAVGTRTGVLLFRRVAVRPVVVVAARASRVRRRRGGRRGHGGPMARRPTPLRPVPLPRTARPRERVRLSNKRATCARRRHLSSRADLLVAPPDRFSRPTIPSTVRTGFRVNSINVLFKTLNAPESPRSRREVGGGGERTVGES